MHMKFPDVNGALFLWRDGTGLVHTSKRSLHGVTALCGEFTSEMAYAGRQGFSTATVTCLHCIVTP